MIASKREDGQKEVMRKSMYRFSLFITAVLGLAIFAVYLLMGHGELMAQDPFNYLLDIVVRSLAAPLIAMPCIWLYYRKQFREVSFFKGVAFDDSALTAFFSLIVTLLVVWITHGCLESLQISPQTIQVIYISFYCCLLGVSCVLVKVLPALFVIEIVGCSLFLLIGSYSCLLICGCGVVAGFLGAYVARLIVQTHEALDTGKPNYVVRTCQRVFRFFFPRVKQKS